ncbi:MAG TPA: Clp protease N-terminal domain-containing protein [Armatimonadota bacterium]|nr:Clp protease N-terminal domain-containing protein [Armatimonadota bacterium]
MTWRATIVVAELQGVDMKNALEGPGKQDAPHIPNWGLIVKEHEEAEFEEVLPYTTELNEAAFSAMIIALARGQAAADPDHLLYTIVVNAKPPRRAVPEHDSARGRDLLVRAGADLSALQGDLEELLGPPVPNPLWDAYEVYLADCDAVRARINEKLDQARKGSDEDWNAAVVKAVAIAEAETPDSPGEWSAALKALMKAAVQEARESGSRFAGTDHAVIAIARERASAAARLLERRGLTPETLFEAHRSMTD